MEDLAKAQNTLLNTTMDEKVEDDLGKRFASIQKHLLNNVLTKYDYNGDDEIEAEEFITLKLNDDKNENKTEAKTDAYVMFNLIDQCMGDSNERLSDDEIRTFAKYADEKGMDLNEYYNWLLQNNFKAKEAGNHQYYEDVLNAFKTIKK